MSDDITQSKLVGWILVVGGGFGGTVVAIWSVSTIVETVIETSGEAAGVVVLAVISLVVLTAGITLVDEIDNE